MGIISEEIGRYDSYTDKFIKNTTLDRIEIGTDGNLYRLTISNGNEYLPKDKLYTKADMVAMLTELQLKIKELDSRAGYDGNGMPTFSTDYIRKKKVNELIQQKINALEGNENA